MSEKMRIVAGLREQIQGLEASIDLWETGKLTIHLNGFDISDQQIPDMLRQIARLEQAIGIIETD